MSSPFDLTIPDDDLTHDDPTHDDLQGRHAPVLTPDNSDDSHSIPPPRDIDDQGVGTFGGLHPVMSDPSLVTPLWTFESMSQTPLSGDSNYAPTPFSTGGFPYTQIMGDYRDVETPTTAVSPWPPLSFTTRYEATPSALDPHASLDPPWGVSPTSFHPQYSGLSPMLANFMASPNDTNLRTGPIRGHSFTGVFPRRRSSTLGSGMSPVTPQTTFTSPYSIRTQPRGDKRPPVRDSGTSLPQTPQTIRPTSSQTSTVTPEEGSDTSPRHKRIHPSPGIPALSVKIASPLNPGGIESSHDPTSVDDGVKMKAPRFRPTKEQVEMLIKVYEVNKNPDAPTREALAKQLGPGIRPKTLQIWFQNRRSKSRTKEKETMPRYMMYSTPVSSGSQYGRERSSFDFEALRALMHDDDDLVILPITVLSISAWTRFLTPGSGLSAPDLGAALRFFNTQLPPQLNLYVKHKFDTFRIIVTLSPQTVSGFAALTNDLPDALDAVAIRFELGSGSCTFSSWAEHQGGYDGSEWQNSGSWVSISDFTSGEATSGGRCELTGEREILLPAFSKVQQLLTGQLTPLTGPHSQFSNLPEDDHLTTDPITPFPHSFKFPPNVQHPPSVPMARAPFNLLSAGHQVVDNWPARVYQKPVGLHQRQRSFSDSALPNLASNMGYNSYIEPGIDFRGQSPVAPGYVDVSSLSLDPAAQSQDHWSGMVSSVSAVSQAGVWSFPTIPSLEGTSIEVEVAGQAVEESESEFEYDTDEEM